MKNEKGLLYILILFISLITFSVLIRVNVVKSKELNNAENVIAGFHKCFYDLAIDNSFNDENIEFFDSLARAKVTINDGEILVLFILKSPICLSCFESFYDELMIEHEKIVIITDSLGRISLNFWIKNNNANNNIILVDKRSLEYLKSYNIVVSDANKNLLVTMDKRYPPGLMINLVKLFKKHSINSKLVFTNPR